MRLDSRVSITLKNQPTTYKDLLYIASPYLDDYSSYRDNRALTFFSYFATIMNAGCKELPTGGCQYEGELHGYFKVVLSEPKLLLPLSESYRFTDFPNRPSVIIEFDLEIKSSNCPPISFDDIISSHPMEELRDAKLWREAGRSIFGLDFVSKDGVIQLNSEMISELSPYKMNLKEPKKSKVRTPLGLTQSPKAGSSKK